GIPAGLRRLPRGGRQADRDGHPVGRDSNGPPPHRDVDAGRGEQGGADLQPEVCGLPLGVQALHENQRLRGRAPRRDLAAGAVPPQWLGADPRGFAGAAGEAAGRVLPRLRRLRAEADGLHPPGRRDSENRPDPPAKRQPEGTARQAVLPLRDERGGQRQRRPRGEAVRDRAARRGEEGPGGVSEDAVTGGRVGPGRSHGRSRMNRQALWFKRVMWLGILVDWLQAIPAIFAPNWVLGLAGQTVSENPTWVAFAALLMFLLSLFYLP